MQSADGARFEECRVAVHLPVVALADDELRVRNIEPGMERRARRALHAVIRPEHLRAVSEPHRLVGLAEVGPGRTLATLAGLHPARGTAPVMASMRHPGEPVSDLEHMLGAMGRLWVGGVEPDWARFYHGQRRRRVSMPTYAFDHQRCWVDAEAQTTSTIPADGRQGDVGQWLYQPVWLRSAATVDATCSGARVLVVAGPHDVAKSAVEALRGAGADVRVVREWRPPHHGFG